MLIPRGLSVPHLALWLTTQGSETLYSIWKGKGRLEEAVISSFQFHCSCSKLKVGKSTGQCCSRCSSMAVWIWLPRSCLADTSTCCTTKMGEGRQGEKELFTNIGQFRSYWPTSLNTQMHFQPVHIQGILFQLD